MSISSEPIMHQDGIRRSSRTSKPISRFGKRDLSSGEESDKNTRRSSRPKRSRKPVDRFEYEAPTRSSSRRRSSEVRNLDQYSTEDEYMGGHSGNNRRRKRSQR